MTPARVGVDHTPDLRVDHADAQDWLLDHAREYRHRRAGVVTSLPDMSELADLGQPHADDPAVYLSTVRTMVADVLRFVGPQGLAVFYQTDRRYDGRLLSKAAEVMRAGASMGRRPVWHKVVCTRRPGVVSMRRPGYSHLIAYATSPGTARPDVLVDPGYMEYANAMPAGVVRDVLNWWSHLALSPTRLVDPYAGSGTVLRAARECDWLDDAVGVDVDGAMVKRARLLLNEPLPR